MFIPLGTKETAVALAISIHEVNAAYESALQKLAGDEVLRIMASQREGGREVELCCHVQCNRCSRDLELVEHETDQHGNLCERCWHSLGV